MKGNNDTAVKEPVAKGNLDGEEASGIVTPPARDMEVTIQELKSALDNNEDIFLMDVRSQAEYDAGHVAGVDTVIPHTKFMANEVSMPVAKDKYIYVICRSGRRSAIALKWLRENGYIHSYNVIGGMLAWADNGFPVEQ